MFTAGLIEMPALVALDRADKCEKFAVLQRAICSYAQFKTGKLRRT
jgi:hypothetical protein